VMLVDVLFFDRRIVGHSFLTVWLSIMMAYYSNVK